MSRRSVLEIRGTEINRKKTENAEGVLVRQLISMKRDFLYDWN